MSANIYQNGCRWITTLAIAAFIAASMAMAPAMLDEATGTSMVPSAHAGDACHASGGC